MSTFVDFGVARAIYGAAADRPDTHAVGDKALFVACDEGNQLYQVQSGNWVKVPGPGLAVLSHNRPVMELGSTDAGTITADTLITVYDSAGTAYQIPAKAV